MAERRCRFSRRNQITARWALPLKGWTSKPSTSAWEVKPTFAGRDVKGKAVFIFSMLGAPNEGAVRRADEKGAAAVFEVNMLPGNARYQAYPARTTGPAFTVGHDDGTAARDLIATAPAGQAAHVKVKLAVDRVPNLKTALVWGTLPGATDETIYIMAHRDGWFDASGDNAGGVASMLGLAEHYGKIPQAQRKRTMIFIGLDGHHNSGEGPPSETSGLPTTGKLFAKTALAINVEHPSTIQTQSRPRYYNANEIAWGNTFMPQQWYAGGPQRPELQKIAAERVQAVRRDDGSLSESDSPGQRHELVLPLPAGIDTGEYHHYFHTDRETPQTVPWTGSGGLDALLREDHRRSKQAAAERVPASRGINDEPAIDSARGAKSAQTASR